MPFCHQVCSCSTYEDKKNEFRPEVGGEGGREEWRAESKWGREGWGWRVMKDVREMREREEGEQFPAKSTKAVSRNRTTA